MECKELLTTYWSQLTLIFVGIGSLIFYFTKRYFDNKSKKIEINHSLYQQNRLKSINRFFGNYAKAERMWSQIALYDILSRKLAPKEIDKIISPVLNELKKNLLELRIYFTETDYKIFNLLVDNVFAINNKLTQLYLLEYDRTITFADKSGDYDLFRLKTYRENEDLLLKLSEIIRETYKS
jgi:hypothetical protein